LACFISGEEVTAIYLRGRCHGSDGFVDGHGSCDGFLDLEICRKVFLGVFVDIRHVFQVGSVDFNGALVDLLGITASERLEDEKGANKRGDKNNGYRYTGDSTCSDPMRAAARSSFYHRAGGRRWIGRRAVRSSRL